MPTTPDGLHYLDDPRELQALIQNWGPQAAPECIVHGSIVEVRYLGKSCYASREAVLATGFHLPV